MRSNGQYLALLPTPPLPDTGWQVTVYAHTDLFAYARGDNPEPVARIARYVALNWSPELSDTGAGTITLSATDPLWRARLANGDSPSALWRHDNLWVITEDGQWRGEFLGMKVDIEQVAAAEHAGRTITISGPGGAQALAWARVLSPYWPKTTPKGKNGVHQFKNMPVMACWLQLLWAAQRRQVIPYVHARFDETRDSGGAKWEDTPPKKPKNTAVTTLGTALFADDSSALNAAGVAAVKALARKIDAATTYPRVTCEGHTDSRGSAADNYQLGLDRANTVRNAILAERPLASITCVSRGETRPAASNATAAGRARNRRVVVTYQSSPAYVDSVYTPERGTSLLDLLRQLTSGTTMAENRGPIHCEWLMGKGFALQVRSRIGVDRSAQVVYHEGSPYLAAETLSADRSELANVISVQDDQTAYRVSTDPASVERWGRREAYTRIEGSYSAKVHALIADATRRAMAQEVEQTTVTVQPGARRVPFRDYQLGDWIGVARGNGVFPSKIYKQRVVAISVRVDAAGAVSYQLTLTGVRQNRVAWLKLLVEALINRKKGIRAFISDDEPTGGLPGDLWTPQSTVGSP